MNRLPTIRPYRLGRDTQEACHLEAAAFTEDYRRMGEDPRLEASRERRMERIVSRAARIVPPLKYSRLGYVAEVQGRMASLALFSRDGLKGPCWSIDAVGTHPEYQGQGLAKGLLKHVLRTIRAFGGESCTLKVRQDNTVAYRMYQGLGFAHFHTSRQMRCEIADLRCVSTTPMDGLEMTTRRAWYALWPERMALSVRSTPPHVQQYRPVTANNFRRSKFIRALGPWVMKLSGCKFDQWIVRKGGVLVATLRVSADLTTNRSHEIRLTIDPDWRSQLAEPLVQMACRQLANLPAKGTLIEVDGSEDAVVDALTRAGFEDMSIWHWLGVRIDRAMAQINADEQALDSVTV